MSVFTDTVTIEALAESGATTWLSHAPEGSVVPFAQTYQPVGFDNGPVSEPEYTDDTWHVGLNLGALTGGVGRAVLGKPNLALSFESKYWDGARFGQECHLQGCTSDGATTVRPMGFFIAHDASDVGVQFSVDRFLISTKDGIGRLQLNTVNNSIDVGVSTAPIKIRFVKNDTSAVQQLRASGGSYADLLYLDASDVATIAVPLNVVAPRKAGTGATAFATIQPTTAVSGDTMLNLAGPALTGALSGVVARAQASGRFQQEFTNQGAGGSRVRIGVEGAGDPTVEWNVNGGPRFVAGIRQSTGAFTVSTGGELGSGDVLALTAAGALTLGGLPVTFGAADSAGTGYRTMRVPN